VVVGGWKLDFLHQICIEEVTQRAMKLKLRWEKTAFAPYVPDEEPSAEDKAFLGSDPCVVWLWWGGEWEHWQNIAQRNADPKWHTYEVPADNAALEAGLTLWRGNPSEATACCAINNHYSANFELMQQFKTGDPWRARPIARAVYKWLWRDDAGSWQPYSPEACAVIERGLLSREIVVPLSITLKGAPGPQSYEVNLVEMCQFRKGSKFNRRDVKRVGTPLSSAYSNSLRINAELRSFGELLPTNWSPFPPDKGHVTVTLDMKSEEAQKLVQLMNRTIAPEGHGNKFGVVAGLRVDPRSFVVEKIERLQTLRTWKAYVAAKLRIVQRWGSNVPNLNCSRYLRQYKLIVPMIEAATKEYYLFHGCQPSFVEALRNADKAFDARCVGLHNMYGAGLYFAENSSKSNQYIPCPM